MFTFRYKSKADDFSKLNAIKYDSIMDLCLSDHKPVYAIFEIKLFDKTSVDIKNKRHTIDVPSNRPTINNVSNSKACIIF
jgi:hypothetical protein